MKQILRLGEDYALSDINRCVFYTLLISIFTVFWPDSAVKAQFYKPSAVTVSMGETLSESFYQTVHQAVNARTGEAMTIKLADYRDKLIILDFWATWCKPCIGSLNKLDSIARDWQDDRYVVIPVTDQNAAQAAPGFKKFRWNMTSIVADTLLAQIFPHSSIPHQVWVKEGKVIAVPDPSFPIALADNIRRVLSSQPLAMQMQAMKVQVFPERALFTNGNGGNGEHILARTAHGLIAGWVNDAEPQEPKIIPKKDSTVVYALNMTAERLLYEVFKQDIFKDYSLYIKNLRTITLTDGMLREIRGIGLKARLNRPKPGPFSGQEFSTMLEKWQEHNSYSFQLSFPGHLELKEALKLSQKELADFFQAHLGIKAEIEDRPQKFYILSATGTLSGLKSAGGKPFSNYMAPYYIVRNFKINALRRVLNSVDPNLMVFDETNFTDRIDIQLSKKIDGNLAFANKELSKYNLQLKEGIRSVPLLIIHD